MQRIQLVGQSASVTNVARTLQRWYAVTRWPRVSDACTTLGDDKSVLFLDVLHARTEPIEALLKLRQSRGRIVCLVPISDVGVRSFSDLVRQVPNLAAYAMPSAAQLPDEETIREVMFEPDHGPVSAVLPSLIEIVAPQRPYLLGASMICGRKRLRSSVFARLCGVAPRTAQVLAKHEGLPSPSHLQRWGLLFWLHWRMQHWGLSGKQAAAAAGFNVPATIYSITRILTGLSPVALARKVDLRELVLLAAKDMRIETRLVRSATVFTG